jgi:hypothetical protein
MTIAPEHYTATMADLYAAQGYLEEAVRVYQHLLSESPGRQDLAERLSEVQRRLSREREGSGGRGPVDAADGSEDLKALLKEWVGLVLEYNRVSALKRRYDAIQQRTI